MFINRAPNWFNCAFAITNALLIYFNQTQYLPILHVLCQYYYSKKDPIVDLLAIFAMMCFLVFLTCGGENIALVGLVLHIAFIIACHR